MQSMADENTFNWVTLGQNDEAVKNMDKRMKALPTGEEQKGVLLRPSFKQWSDKKWLMLADDRQ